MHTAVKFDGETAFAAVEIDDVIFNRVLAAEFEAHAPVTQQVSVVRRRMGVSPMNTAGDGRATCVAQFADAPGADSHDESAPSPAPALRGPLSPRERAVKSNPAGQHRGLPCSTCNLAKSGSHGQSVSRLTVGLSHAKGPRSGIH